MKFIKAMKPKSPLGDLGVSSFYPEPIEESTRSRYFEFHGIKKPAQAIIQAGLIPSISIFLNYFFLLFLSLKHWYSLLLGCQSNRHFHCQRF